MSVDRKIQPSGHLLRTEPSNVEWMQKFPLALKRVKKIGWYDMSEKIAEHHIGVTKAFCNILWIYSQSWRFGIYSHRGFYFACYWHGP